MHRRTVLLGLGALGLGACGADNVYAPTEAITRARYRHPGPPRITLFTMRNTSTDNGAHTGLMINASQRVIFDGAGDWYHETIPERHDVHYGITPRNEAFYVSSHARMTFYLERVDKDVSPEVAELALQLAEANGPVPKAACTRAASRILAQLPGFESIRVTWLPDTLSRQFRALPGTQVSIVRENDSPVKQDAIDAFTEQLRSEGTL